jgi:hypothetical protein
MDGQDMAVLLRRLWPSQFTCLLLVSPRPEAPAAGGLLAIRWRGGKLALRLLEEDVELSDFPPPRF